MSRTLALCGLGIATGDEVCCELPAYRIEACTYDGKRVILYLCSEHIHRAWLLAQLLMDKRHPGESLKVRSIHLYQLAKASAAEAAS